MGATGLLSKKTGHQIGHVLGVTHHVAKHYIVGQLESSRYCRDIEGALKIAPSEKYPFSRGYAFKEIAIAQANSGDFESALASAKKYLA